MIKIIKREELTELEEDGSWSIDPPFSEWNEVKEFKSMEEALNWVKNELPKDVKLTDLEECNGNDLQININEKITNDKGVLQEVGKNLSFIFYEEIEIDTAELSNKIKEMI